MFDIGFSEILVIAVVALIVIGPERLPKVARTLGHLFGRMQRYVNDVKADISREMELEELRKLQASMHDAARSIEHSLNDEIDSAQSALRDISAPASAQLPVLPPHATEAEPVPSAGGQFAASGAASTPQLELGLDTANPVNPPR